MKTGLMMIGLVLGSVLPARVFAQQNYIDDLRAVNLAYRKLHTLSMDIQYNLYGSWEGKKLLQGEKGQIKQSGDRMYMKLADMEFVRQPQYSLIAYHEEKTITITANFGAAAPMDYQTLLAALEQDLKRCQSVNYKDLPEHRFQYDIVLKDGYSEYKRIVLTVDRDNFLLTGLVLYYAEPQDLTDAEKESAPRLEMQYSNVQTDKPISDNYFTYERFLKLDNNKLKCLDKYRTYELESTWSPVK